MTKQPRIAFVYDRVNKWGGAERVLLALHEIWPDAPLYTAVYDSKRAPWANVFDVRPSFLQHFPFAPSHHELYPWLTQMAFESFSFDEYDVVISVTSAEAKAIITKPQTLHICYCLTPTRYLWSGYATYQETATGLMSGIHKILTPTLRQWDLVASSRPDTYLAISQSVADRIQRYYGRVAQRVIYPPVDTERFTVHSGQWTVQKKRNADYFLVVSRLVGYKRIDIIIQVCNRLKLPLIVIGDGRARGELMSIAGATIQFVTGHLTDEEVAAYYGNCRAFITMADEDFGIATAEAQAMGVLVIGFRGSGTAEIVIDEKTGTLVGEQTSGALIHALKKFDTMHFSLAECQKNAARFSKARFAKEMKQTVDKRYETYNDESGLSDRYHL